MPRTEWDRIQVDFLARSYEAEGLEPSQAQAFAIREWSRSVTANPKEESYFPKTPEDKKEVKRLAKEYEEQGYGPLESQFLAIESWRNAIRIKIL